MNIYEKKLTDGNILHIEAASDKTFRVRIAEEWEQESAMNRYGFIMEQTAPEVWTEEKDGHLLIKTAFACLEASLEDGAVKLMNAKGECILESAKSPVKHRRGYEAAFALKNGSRIYGLGDVTRERIEKSAGAARFGRASCP